MAIKGKRRARGGGRTVATAPRRAPVVPKKPLFQRTGFRVTVLAILLAGILTGVLFGLAQKRASDREEREKEAVASVGVRIDGALEGVSQATPPIGVLILPELSQAVSELQGKDPKVGQLGEAADTWAEDLQAAADEMGKITTANADLREAKEEMQRALQLFVSIVRSFGVAVDLEGDDRAALIEPLTAEMTLAQSVFQAGYGKYQTVRSEVGLSTQQGGLPPGGFPGGGLPPGVQFPPPGG